MKKRLTVQMLEKLHREQGLLSKEMQRHYVGGGNGSLSDPYTMDEYYTMLNSGTWTGGYIQSIDGIRYGYPETRVYSGGYTDSSGIFVPGTATSTECTLASFIRSLESSGLEQISGVIKEIRFIRHFE